MALAVLASPAWHAAAKKPKAEIIGLGDLSGTYYTFDVTPLRLTGSFTVDASESPLDLEIYIDQGKNFATTRRLKGKKSNFLGYAIYKDAGYSQEWGWASPNGLSLTWSGSPVLLYFYLEIPAGQEAAGGSYDDRLKVTVDVI